MPRHKTLAGLGVLAFALLILIFQPPLVTQCLQGSIILHLLFYLGLGVLSAYLLLYRPPLTFVEPKGKAVFITGKQYIFRVVIHTH